MISKTFANDIIEYIKMISFFEPFKIKGLKPKFFFFTEKKSNIVIF